MSVLENSKSHKKNVALLFGGQSAEHEISIRSVKNIFKFLDPSKYNPILIGLCKDGRWCHVPSGDELENFTSLEKTPSQWENVTLFPGENHNLLFLSSQKEIKIDIIFPVLHGPQGEDGSLQGLLKIYNIPFVGADTLGSAIGMDKDIMKKLFQQEGLPIGKYETLYQWKELPSFEQLTSKVGQPFFIKPANMGSSIGIHKIHNKEEFEDKIQDSFKYDQKVLVEEFLPGREIECAILGSFSKENSPQASGVGEINAQNNFYSYEAKYIHDDGAELRIPAHIDSNLIQQIQTLSLRAFQCLELYGLARVDFFLTAENQVFINEVNTMPGFTRISMYPQLWQQSGISYSDLIDQLLQLAEKR